MVNAGGELVVSDADIEDAEARLERFAPFIIKEFPETLETNGLIEYPMIDLPNMQKELEKQYNCEIPGRLMRMVWPAPVRSVS